jgi:hypothetical protein
MATEATHSDPVIVQPHLAVQDLSSLRIEDLTPLTPDVISRQATINIGTIGHVAHGKSTVVKAISGVQTVRFKNELVRNITIKLGYANAKVIVPLCRCVVVTCVCVRYTSVIMRGALGLVAIALIAATSPMCFHVILLDVRVTFVCCVMFHSLIVLATIFSWQPC